MKLFDYFRSTAVYRVRIVLALKEIPYETVPIHLINGGGEQYGVDYTEKNPQSLVPTLETESGYLSQSLAIIEYLEDLYPHPPILPKDPFGKAKVRSLAHLIACDMHPLNNLRVLQYLQHELQVSELQKTTWYHHWLRLGFDAFEKHVSSITRSPHFCYGDAITLADVCLIPQIYNAERFEFSMVPYPRISAIHAYCMTLPAFKKAQPRG